MIDFELSADVKSIRVKPVKKNGFISRKCTVVFEREFDDEIAAALGGDARQALKALRSGGLSSCVLPTKAINAQATLVAGKDKCAIGELVGVKATGTAPDPDAETDFPPSVALEFTFAWSEEAWVFFGRHCGGQAFLSLKGRQLELAKPSGSGKSASA